MRSKKTQYAAMLALAAAGTFALTSCSSSSTFEFENTSFGPSKTITVTFPKEVLEAENSHPITIQSVTMTGKGETSSLCRVDFEFNYYKGAVQALSETELTEASAASYQGGYIIRFYEALLHEADRDLREIEAAPDDFPKLRAAIEETQGLYKNGKYVDEWDKLVRPAFPEIERAFLEANRVESFAEYVETKPYAVQYIVNAYTPDETSNSANFDVNPTMVMDISGGMTSYMEQVVERITASWESKAAEAAKVPAEVHIAKRIGFPDGASLKEFDEDTPIQGAYFSEDLTSAIVIMGCSDFGDVKSPNLDGPSHELKFMLLRDGNTVIWDSTQLEFVTDPEGNVAIANAKVGSSLDSVVEGWPEDAMQ